MSNPLQDAIDGASSTGSKVPALNTPASKVSTADVRARLALNADRPNNAATDLRIGDDMDGSTMSLPSKEIRLYDKNPRRSVNPSYDEIRESIKIKGVLNPISVTRRPGSNAYMVYGGGNTRLQIMQELCDEYPGNPLYSKMQVVFRAWKAESDVLTAHLIENDARGDTSFWDKACGLIALKKELEAETKGFLSANELRLKAAALGLKVSRDAAQLYDFAVDRLAALGPWLRFNSARLLRERIGALTNLTNRLDMQAGTERFRGMLDELLQRHACELQSKQDNSDLLMAALEVDAAALVAALDECVCASFGLNGQDLRLMLSVLQSHPLASASQLRKQTELSVATAQAKQQASLIPTPTAALLDSPSPSSSLPPTQVPLPTPILAAVPSMPSRNAAGASANPRDGIARCEDSGASPLSPPSDEQHVAADSGAKLFEALSRMASATYNEDLFTAAPRMPLGFYMEVPPVGLTPLPQSPMPAAHQIRLRLAGWQLLATLSGQFDRRCCNGQNMPDSAWLHAVQSNETEVVLRRCGLHVQDGRILLDADCLFFVLTEPTLLCPSTSQILRSLLAVASARRPEQTLLPPLLELVTKVGAAPRDAA